MIGQRSIPSPAASLYFRTYWSIPGDRCPYAIAATVLMPLCQSAGAHCTRAPAAAPLPDRTTSFSLPSSCTKTLGASPAPARGTDSGSSSVPPTTLSHPTPPPRPAMSTGSIGSGWRPVGRLLDAVSAGTRCTQTGQYNATRSRHIINVLHAPAHAKSFRLNCNALVKRQLRNVQRWTAYINAYSACATRTTATATTAEPTHEHVSTSTVVRVT